jgi:NIMA (never in mitosis gene a)-related kinase
MINLQVKLGDFGISKAFENTGDYAKSFLGTPYFLSPEICSGCPYNSKSDIWAIGCVLYECASLKKPFKGDTIMVINIVI